MPIIYLSPSTQENNLYVNGGTEEEWMNRLADAMELAWRNGAKFDSWSEYFDYQRWMDALEACGLDGDFYAHRARPRSEVFPWCRIDPMVTPAFLWHERELCYQSQTTPDCRTRCSGCGANRLLKGGVCNG